MRRRPSLRSLLTAAVAGVIAGGAGVAAAQLAAAIIRPQSSPLVTVGGTLIDATPTPLKEFAIRQFGTNDKLALLTGIGVGLTVFAAVIGLIARRYRLAGLIGVGLFGVIGVAAALTRPAHEIVDVVPALLGGGVAVAVLALLEKTLDGARRPIATPPPAADDAPVTDDETTPDERIKPDGIRPAAGTAAGRPGGLARRGFLRVGGAVAIGAVVVGTAGDILTRLKAGSAEKVRDTLRLPAPTDAGPPMESTPGFYTSNSSFYRVDTALAVPQINPDNWQLRIHGMVDHPMTLSFDQLLGRPLIQRDITLNCVSNEVGGPYVGTARWLGAPLAALLREAGVQAGADQVVARSIDGMTIGTPVATIMDGRDAMLVVGMNGQPLPLEHGFPVRMLTPGLYGYVGACKWLIDLEVTTFAAYDPYWVKRKWSAQAPVKTASRIDRPVAFTPVPAGAVKVQGVAWAQHRGIKKVEVQVDNGPWETATLSPVPSTDTWVQWSWSWTAAKGSYQVRVRATDGTGAVQPEARVGTFPNGVTGWHTLAVTVN